MVATTIGGTADLLRDASIRGPLNADRVFSTLLDVAVQDALRHPEIASVLEDLERASAESPRSALETYLHSAARDIFAAASRELAESRKYLVDLDQALTSAVRQVLSEDRSSASQFDRLIADAERHQANILQMRDKAAASAASDQGSEGAVSPTALSEAEVELELAVRQLALMREAAVRRILHQLSEYPAVAASLAETESALSRLRRALVERGALDVGRPWLRGLLEERLSERYSLDLPEQDALGLSELSNPEHEVATKATEALSSLVNRLPGGSIGVSGPRGSGKSTLLRSVCREDQPVRGLLPSLTVLIPAPVQYVPLEFVLHLFASACNRAIPEDLREEALELHTRPLRAIAPIVFVTLLAAGALAALGMFTVATTLLDSSIPVSERGFALGLAAVTSGMVVMVLVASRRSQLLMQHGYPSEFAGEGNGSWGRAGLLEELAYRATGGPLILALPWIALVLVALTTGAAFFAELPRGAVASFAAGVTAFALVAILFRPLNDWAASWIRRALDEWHSPNTARTPSFEVRVSLVTWISVAHAVTYLSAIVTFVAAGVAAGALIGAIDRPQFAAGLISGAAGIIALSLALRLHGDAARAQAWSSTSLVSRMQSQPAVALRAVQHLREIKYQQTSLTGWSDKVSMGLGASATVSAERAVSQSRSLAERHWTLPDATEKLREFLRLAATDAPVVVGIDELDKMSPETAEGFLNGTKGIFGVERCYFLLSVSEDAVASFERRGLPLRDVFDSSFDEVVRVGYLSLRETERLLSARVVRMPMQFIALCYCIAGGLPRDVVRAARTLFKLRQHDPSGQLSDLAHRLIRADFDAKCDATRIALATVRRSQGAQAIAALSELKRAGPSTEMLGRIPPIAGPSTEAQGDQEPVETILELMSYDYFATTLIDVFDASLDATRMREAEEEAETGGTLLQLAIARQDFALGALPAWQRISEFRGDWGLAVSSIETLQRHMGGSKTAARLARRGKPTSSASAARRRAT